MPKTACFIGIKHGLWHCPGNVFRDNYPEDITELKQLIHTDRDMTNKKQLITDSYIGELNIKDSNLSSHHYITVHQSRHTRSIRKLFKGKATCDGRRNSKTTGRKSKFPAPN